MLGKLVGKVWTGCILSGTGTRGRPLRTQ